MSEAEVPVSAVPIPDEAVDQAIDRAYESLGVKYPGGDCDEIIRAVAPFIARAAQVQVLKRLTEAAVHGPYPLDDEKVVTTGEIQELIAELEGRADG